MPRWSYTEILTNEEALEGAGERRNLMNTTRKRQVTFMSCMKAGDGNLGSN